MANVTLTINADVLRRARLRALEQGTSVNALIREYLEGFAGDSDSARGLRDFLASAHASAAGSGPEGRTWTRADLYDDRSRHRG
ncbi:MAG TPA: hypothetical protein VHE14_05595 [Solirubrobacteraceae bacterium]|nr:hypothetical protein [Solirubrobacteraceae bacterium]